MKLRIFLLVLFVATVSQQANSQTTASFLDKYKMAKGAESHEGKGKGFRFNDLQLGEETPRDVFKEALKDLTALVDSAGFEQVEPLTVLDFRGNADAIRFFLPDYKVYLLHSGEMITEAIIVIDHTNHHDEAPYLSITCCYGNFTSDTLHHAFRYDFGVAD